MVETDSAHQSDDHNSASDAERQTHFADAPSRRGLLFNVVIPLGLLAAAGLVVFLLGSVSPAERPADDTTRAGRLRALAPVRVEPIRSLKSTGQQLQLVADGNVVPFQEARVAAEVAGRIVYKSDLCEAGTFVEQGQLLMRIDPTDYELEVQRLTRLQEQEYQALVELDQEIANTQRLIEVAKKDVAIQQKEVDRLRSLPDGFASRAEIDQANRQLLAAQQQLLGYENQAALLNARRTRLEASERLAATQLKAATTNLERTNIRAPISGVIVSEEVDLNAFAARGNPLVIIDDTSKVEVAINLRMDQLFWILDQEGERPNDPSRIYDLPDTPAIIEYEVAGRENAFFRWEGQLVSYDGIGLDTVSRTVPVRVVVDDPTRYVNERGEQQPVTKATPLVRGMFVRVKLLLQPQTPLVVIPARAIQPGNRVLEFIPDEKVLAQSDQSRTNSASSRKSDNGNPATTSPSTDEPGDASDTDGKDKGSSAQRFDPDRWRPGRVVVHHHVSPVDAITIHQEPPREPAEDSSLAGNERLWVCESPEASLRDGSLVVVSPVGNIEQSEIPVRAELTTEGLTESIDQAWQLDRKVPASATTTAQATGEGA